MIGRTEAMTTLFKPRIIGGGFGLEPGNAKFPRAPAFLSQPHLMLATARSAFTLLDEYLRPRQVWLPSYLCAAVLEAFPTNRTRIRFYAVDEQLRLRNTSWLRQVLPGDLVVFIDYFGFTVWGEHAREARQSGAWVVEDACQALLNACFSDDAHYVVLSPRKFVGVPDGGILLARNGAAIPAFQPAPIPQEWWRDALAACQLRAEFDLHGGERTWFPLFQKTDRTGPYPPMKMSELSANLLQHRIDYDENARRRRENYEFLTSELGHVAVFSHLGSGVVPLGFPVRIRDRDRIRQALFAAEIYPAVHWPIAGVVPPEFELSHRLSSQIMTLPSDQRYTQSDMERIVTHMKALNPAIV